MEFGLQERNYNIKSFNQMRQILSITIIHCITLLVLTGVIKLYHLSYISDYIL